MIKHVEIKNFKAIKSFKMDLQGSFLIKGKHRVGKTTIADAITWALTSRDLADTKSFDPKPKDSNGDYLDLTTSVRVVFSDNSFVYRELQLKKNKEGEITGNTNRYYIEPEIECKKADYDAFILNKFNIDNLDNLYLILSPIYFSVGMSMADKRKILMKLAGITSRQEIINKFTKDKGKLEILNELVKEDLYKKSSNMTTLINRTSKRSDELNSLIDSYSDDIMHGDFSSDIERYKELKEKLSAIKSKDRDAKIPINIDDINEENKVLSELRNKAADLRLEIGELKSQLKVDKSDYIRELESLKEQYELEINQVRVQAKETQAMEFNSLNCSQCSQPLPSEMLESLENSFNADRAKKFNKLRDRGIELSELIKDLEAKLDNAIISNEHGKKENEILNKKIEEINKELIKLEESISNKPRIMPIYNEDKESEELMAKLTKELEPLEALIEKLNVSKHSAEKVKEYEAQLKDSLVSYNDLVYRKSVIDDYAKFEIEHVEESVSVMFETVKFKLFHIPINGEPRPICEPMINGIEYNQLNGAGRIQVHVEISRALRQHFGKDILSIIDYRESGTEAKLGGNSIMLQAVEDLDNSNNVIRHIDGKEYEIYIETLN